MVQLLHVCKYKGKYMATSCCDVRRRLQTTVQPEVSLMLNEGGVHAWTCVGSSHNACIFIRITSCYMKWHQKFVKPAGLFHKHPHVHVCVLAEFFRYMDSLHLTAHCSVCYLGGKVRVCFTHVFTPTLCNFTLNNAWISRSIERYGVVAAV